MGEDELVIVVTDKDGNTKTLSSDEPDPTDRSRGIQFSSQTGSGFYTGSFNLSCPIDREREDLHLLDDVRIVTGSGETVYEGFVAAMPRSTDQDGQGTLNITLAGYMATAAGQPFTMIFVDRDLSAWGPASRTQQIAEIAAGYATKDVTVVTSQAGVPGVKTSFAGPWAAGGTPIADAMYDAGPNTAIGSIYYEWTRGANVNSPADANWAWYVKLTTSDNLASGEDSSAALAAAGPGTGTLTATTARRFAFLRFYYTAAAAAASGEYDITWSSLAVRGNHGLPNIGTANPYGVAASDVIGWLVDNYCPLLNTDGVQATTYGIPHLVFRERTTPYDAMLKVNSYHLWDLAVWEDRTLHFQPVDLTDWDWEVRHDDIFPSQIGLQGDEYTSLRNGIIVQYTNVATGNVEELLPATYDELRDDSLDNPYTAQGWTWYGEPFVIPFPTTADAALQLGRTRLLEDNQPKAPGSFTVTAKIRDRSGQWQPVAKVRAGDRVRLTSSVRLSDRPRKIGEVSYSHDGRSITISVDSTLRVLDAIVDRTQTALQAAGLT
jgi:hypothetical protein